MCSSDLDLVGAAPQETSSSQMQNTEEAAEGVNQGFDWDAEMKISEAGTEDLELRDILDREGMDLVNMVEQWKEIGVEHIPEEQINRINFLFLAQEEVGSKGQKRGHGETKGMGIKVQGLKQSKPKAKPRRKRGRKSNNEALQELGQMLLNSGKMKNLEAFTSSS